MFCKICGKTLNKNTLCINKSCFNCLDNDIDENDEYFNIIPNKKSLGLHTDFRDSNDIYVNEMESFIGEKSTLYFLKQWTKFKENKFFISWNWSTFFFNGTWFFYRKLYLASLIVFSLKLFIFCLIQLVIFNLQLVIFNLQNYNINLNEFILIMSTVSLFISTFISLIANNIYISCSKKD